MNKNLPLTRKELDIWQLHQERVITYKWRYIDNINRSSARTIDYEYIRQFEDYTLSKHDNCMFALINKYYNEIC